MIVAFDTYYYNGTSYTVGGVFNTWGDKEVSYFVTSKRIGIDSEYIPNEFYKRELPCIMQCLSMMNVNDIEIIVIDGFVWLPSDDGELKKGLGAILQDEILKQYGKKVTVIGIAKNKHREDIKGCVALERGSETKKPLFITCSNVSLTRQYALQIEKMSGGYRIPNIIKSVDSKSRQLSKDDNTVKGLDFDLSDLDEWADKELGMSSYDAINVAALVN
jgi:exodeoxyribonuclease-5/deoxyribonuclease V